MIKETKDTSSLQLGSFLKSKNASWSHLLKSMATSPAYWIIIVSNAAIFFLPGINLKTQSTSLLWVYMIQSLMIGFVHVIKLWFYTFTPMNKDNNKMSQRGLAIFFIFHFGFFHFVYSFFLPPSTANWNIVLEGAAIFSFALIWNTIQHYSKENSGKYDANDFIFLPYLRIIPIHFAIILGGFFGGVFGNFIPILVVLMLIKTTMELGMEYFQQLGFSLKEIKTLSQNNNGN